MRALLDVNVLLAIHDPSHLHHGRARTWFDTQAGGGWASCATTQNGFVRVVSQPRYPLAVTTAEAVAVLSRTCSRSNHEFWSESVSVTDEDWVDRSRLHGPGQLTDTYLLALAVRHEGRLVTFDGRIVAAAVPRATPENLVVL